MYVFMGAEGNMYICAFVLLPAGVCDFELDFCGWVNNPPAESGEDWDWLSGDSKGDFIPARDHSTGTSLGKFSHVYSFINCLYRSVGKGTDAPYHYSFNKILNPFECSCRK